MPAEKNFKIGITREFAPLWDEFEKLAQKNEKSKNIKSKMIRYLIYNFLYQNGKSTGNSSKDASSKEWKIVEGAYKVYDKFNRRELKELEERKIGNYEFWIESYDHKIKDKLITEKQIKEYEEGGYEKVDVPVFNLLNKNKIDQERDKIVLVKKLNEEEERERQKISSEEEWNEWNERVRPKIERFLSKPETYYVIYKRRESTFFHYEAAYGKFKSKRKEMKKAGLTSARIIDLFVVNRELDRELGKVFYKKNLQFSKSFFKIAETRERLEGTAQKESMKELLEMMRGNDFEEILKRYQMRWDDPWRETPKEIDDSFRLNKYHIENKRQLRELQSKEEITHNYGVVLKFKENESPKIIGPGEIAVKKIDNEKDGRIYDSR